MIAPWNTAAHHHIQIILYIIQHNQDGLIASSLGIWHLKIFDSRTSKVKNWRQIAKFQSARCIVYIYPWKTAHCNRMICKITDSSCLRFNAINCNKRGNSRSININITLIIAFNFLILYRIKLEGKQPPSCLYTHVLKLFLGFYLNVKILLKHFKI